MSVDLLINRDEYNVFLKYLLLQGLESAEIRFWRLRGKYESDIPLRERLHELLVEIQGVLKSSEGFAVECQIEQDKLDLILNDAGWYRQRIIDLAVETLLSESLAPEICIQIAPIAGQTLSGRWSGCWRHAVIFATPYFFSHEFYPLVVDAYVHDAEKYGVSHVEVVGAHIDWLTDDRKLKRIIYLDAASGRLIEADLEIPIVPDSVQFLCLGRQEKAIHRSLSSRFTCLQINPAAVSSLADDKAATLSAWLALGIEVPAYREIAPGEFAAALSFLERFAEIVVKPNQGTEAELVAYFNANSSETKFALQQHLQQCWQQGNAIVQQRRDGLCYLDPVTGKRHTLALRFNLCADGEGRYCLESGYAQLGLDLQEPAACGRGGRIVAINEVIDHLWSRAADETKPVNLDGKDWLRIREQAEHAASLFDGLLLVGLDVLLDLDKNGKIIPVFLEVNPRPAGLSHSKLISDDPFIPAEIGVSLKLWDNLVQYHPSGFASYGLDENALLA